MSATQPTTVAIIMAGGTGERFWPLSRVARPKQLLHITSERLTMLEEVAKRIQPLVPDERVFIATGRALAGPIRKGRTGVAPANVLAEPAKRNTAGALCWVSAHLLARFGGEAAANLDVVVLAADAVIDDPAQFRATAQAALGAARRHKALATIGVAPDRPETGYGYIEIARDVEPVNAADGEPPVYPVVSFREKPDLDQARQYLAAGRFLWNSGMFFWTLGTFLSELESAAPEHARATRRMAEALAAGDDRLAEEVFEGLPDLSIDYALMERAAKVLVARADFAWDDVGAWDALDRTYPHDEAGNVAVGDPILLEVRDSIVINEPGAERMAVAAIGVEGLAVIVSGDGVLVVPKHRAQQVKQVVAELHRRGAKQV